jgi:hypothetical protein
MSSELQQVIDAARALSLRDKLELLQIIARDLQKVEAFTEASPAFWSLRSLDAIAQSQSAPVITDVHALAVGFWPEDELADDFNRPFGRWKAGPAGLRSILGSW